MSLKNVFEFEWTEKTSNGDKSMKRILISILIIIRPIDVETHGTILHVYMPDV